MIDEFHWFFNNNKDNQKLDKLTNIEGFKRILLYLEPWHFNFLSTLGNLNIKYSGVMLEYAKQTVTFVADPVSSSVGRAADS